MLKQIFSCLLAACLLTAVALQPAPALAQAPAQAPAQEPADISNAGEVATDGAASPVASGQPLPQEQALQLAQKIQQHIYLPAQKFKSLQCEFTPKFFEVDRAANPGLAAQAADGVRLIFFDGNFFFPLQDPALLQAKRAVFHWQQTDTTGRVVPAVALFYDAKDKPLKIHPFVAQRLGLSLIRLQQLDIAQPLLLPAPPYEQWRLKWQLDSANAADKVLNCLFQRTLPGAGEQPRLKTEVHFDNQDTPISAGLFAWDARQKSWQGVGDFYPFKRLGATGPAAISNSGMESDATYYAWAQAGDDWYVGKADGARPDLAGGGEFKRWQVAFSNFQPNTPPPIAQMVLPAGAKVKLNFSSPDATIATVQDCLRQDRMDLLPWCTAQPPQLPQPDRGPGTYLGYLLQTVPQLRDRVQVIGQTQDADATVYTLRVPKLWMKKDIDQQLRIAPAADGQFKVQGDFKSLEAALYK